MYGQLWHAWRGRASTGEAKVNRRILVLVVAIGVLMSSGATAVATQRFSDVPDDHQYAEAIAWAQDQGITKGCDTERFCPEDFVTRAQMVEFLRRTMASKANEQPGPQGPQGPAGPQGPPGQSVVLGSTATTWQIDRREGPIAASGDAPAVTAGVTVEVPDSGLIEYVVSAEVTTDDLAGYDAAVAWIDVLVDGQSLPQDTLQADASPGVWTHMASGSCSAQCVGPGSVPLHPILIELSPGNTLSVCGSGRRS